MESTTCGLHFTLKKVRLFHLAFIHLILINYKKMDYGKKSYSSRWGHARTRTCHTNANSAATARRIGALKRLEVRLLQEEEFKKRNIDNCKDPIAKEALLQAYQFSTGRMQKEINTLKGRI